nr:MAG TPA: hypothetical protein [Bacteriophage sp.]DAP55219.1 MAG TPA: hypothetical protein [Caudoviricetes sp.]
MGLVICNTNFPASATSENAPPSLQQTVGRWKRMV